MIDVVIAFIGGGVVGAVGVIAWMKRKAKKQMNQMMNNMSGAIEDE